MAMSNRLMRCNENDKRLLLIFKQGVVDPDNKLSSWTVEEDCCLWEGVHCDNITGRVTELSLSTTYTLGGDINLCVLQLEFLNSLDLSKNDFKTVSMPPCQISKSLFDAHKFHNQSLAALSNHSASFSVALRYLDISDNDDLFINDLHWLSQLSSIKYLDLSYVDIGNDTKWLQHIAMLPSLSELNLMSCGLTNFPSGDYVNFTSLTVLVLSFNHMVKLPDSLFNITHHIYHLDLRGCNFHGQLPKSLFNLQNLKLLDFSSNNLEGSIPYWFGQYEQLQWLGISQNLFHGVIPSSLGNISSLSMLDLSHNQLNGDLSEKNLANLSSLTYLDLSSTSFKLHFDPKWVPPFQLETLQVSNTSIGPNIPPWLYTQQSLRCLDISASGISNIDADVFWSFISRIDSVDISKNLIGGHNISKIILSANISHFGASYNSLSGSIFSLLCHQESENLEVLDLSYNNLSGTLPDCWGNWKKLRYLSLGSNKLTGIVDLSANSLSGEIPEELVSMSKILSLNLSRNYLTGKIPKEIGGMKNLESLDLSYNKLLGEIPSTISNVSFLAYLNLSYNNFIGQIPSGTQIQSFDSWSFLGNPELCGDPLPKKCNKKEETHGSKLAEEDEDDSFLKSLYLGMGVGFAVGFWGVCGSLFLVRAWRHKFFRWIGHLADQLYVALALYLKSFG
ncbi:receptor-like protein EIX1 [Neltuma alba]|uniref:receptor-like protein EIX1 n=1 Tax=Neltuma alba TaxID=207710 RepID=UPI0010A2EF32|nr:receptor-like protein EIX1 [Prosopis alba]